MHILVKIVTTIATQAAKNIVAVLLTQRMVMWALARYAKSTDTLVDDYAVELVAAGLANDPARIEQAVSKLSDLFLIKPEKVITEELKEGIK